MAIQTHGHNEGSLITVSGFDFISRQTCPWRRTFSVVRIGFSLLFTSPNSVAPSIKSHANNHRDLTGAGSTLCMWFLVGPRHTRGPRISSGKPDAACSLVVLRISYRALMKFYEVFRFWSGRSLANLAPPMTRDRHLCGELQILHTDSCKSSRCCRVDSVCYDVSHARVGVFTYSSHCDHRQTPATGWRSFHHC